MTSLTLRIATFFFLASSLSAADEGGVSAYAYRLFDVFGLPITNSIVTTWVIAAILIFAVRFAVGRPSLVPTKGQAVFEGVYEAIEGVIEPIVGKKMVPHTLPLLLCLFVFILINNYSGLLPGVGAFGHYDDGKLIYWFRPANSDLNGTVALSVVAMVAWLFIVLKHAGVKVLAADVFGNKADKKTTPFFLYLFLSVVFLLVGFIELVSMAIRPLTLSMRLYGNILGGESLLTKIISISPPFVPVALPFYLLETLVGLIQALVFTLLVAVYIGLICNHEESH